ncbi:hypothetical protein GSF70_17215 [Flavobacteriaceae bacterium W22]|nr:hypothetical protein [Flavobacteriaceae bacterium W22]
MKKTFLLVSALASFTAFAQVGINTETPKATLDVVGKPSETDKVDGIIAPRITGDQLKAKTGYGLPQEGTLIYATSGVTGTPSGQTINVTSSGYYYFDGGVWVKQLSGILPTTGGNNGTVTNFSAGDLSPLFTTTEANTTTTPALSFALTNAPANSFFGNTTGAASAPSYNTASNLTSVAGSNTATAPVTISGGSNALVNAAGATVAVNNTAPLWNANQLNGTGVAATTPTNGQVLTYNSTTSTWAPATVATPSVDWHVTGNTDTEISTAAETLDAAVASTNYLGTQGADNLVIATEGKTHAVLDTKGTLIGGGNDASSLSWGKNNTVDTDTNTIALGRDNTASGDFSMVIGRNNSATSTASIAIGGQAITGGGTGTIVPNTNSGTYSSAVGFGNTVSGNKNQVIGIRNVVSSANTAINFLGGTSVLGADNKVASLNSNVVGNNNNTFSTPGASGTPNAVTLLGNSNGNTSKLGGVIVGSSNNSATGYVFGLGNKNTDEGKTDMMSIGFYADTTGFPEKTTTYSNINHFITTSVPSGDAIVGININPGNLTALQKQNDLTVKKQIRIEPQTPTSSCTAETLGAIRFNSSTNKHEGCGAGPGSSTTIGWNALY